MANISFRLSAYLKYFNMCLIQYNKYSFNVLTISAYMFLVIRKFEIFGLDWCSTALDIGKLVISIMCIMNSVDKCLQEFQNFRTCSSAKTIIIRIIT